MKVTTDKYELSVAVADSIRELAKICGVSKRTIYSRMNHFKNGSRYTHCPYVKVVIDE